MASKSKSTSTASAANIATLSLDEEPIVAMSETEESDSSTSTDTNAGTTDTVTPPKQEETPVQPPKQDPVTPPVSEETTQPSEGDQKPGGDEVPPVKEEKKYVIAETRVSDAAIKNVISGNKTLAEKLEEIATTGDTSYRTVICALVDHNNKTSLKSPVNLSPLRLVGLEYSFYKTLVGILENAVVDGGDDVTNTLDIISQTIVEHYEEGLNYKALSRFYNVWNDQEYKGELTSYDAFVKIISTLANTGERATNKVEIKFDELVEKLSVTAELKAALKAYYA